MYKNKNKKIETSQNLAEKDNFSTNIYSPPKRFSDKKNTTQLPRGKKNFGRSSYNDFLAEIREQPATKLTSKPLARDEGEVLYEFYSNSESGAPNDAITIEFAKTILAFRIGCKSDLRAVATPEEGADPFFCAVLTALEEDPAQWDDLRKKAIRDFQDNSSCFYPLSATSQPSTLPQDRSSDGRYTSEIMDKNQLALETTINKEHYYKIQNDRKSNQYIFLIQKYFWADEIAFQIVAKIKKCKINIIELSRKNPDLYSGPTSYVPYDKSDFNQEITIICLDKKNYCHIKESATLNKSNGKNNNINGQENKNSDSSLQTARKDNFFSREKKLHHRGVHTRKTNNKDCNNQTESDLRQEIASRKSKLAEEEERLNYNNPPYWLPFKVKSAKQAIEELEKQLLQSQENDSKGIALSKI